MYFFLPVYGWRSFFTLISPPNQGVCGETGASGSKDERPPDCVEGTQGGNSLGSIAQQGRSGAAWWVLVASVISQESHREYFILGEKVKGFLAA